MNIQNNDSMNAQKVNTIFIESAAETASKRKQGSWLFVLHWPLRAEGTGAEGRP